jgi:hypothetical protein
MVQVTRFLAAGTRTIFLDDFLIGIRTESIFVRQTQDLFCILVSRRLTTVLQWKRNSFMAKRITWTLEPDPDVASLVDKRITEMAGKHGNKRGLRTRIINEALRNALSYLLGKREAA